MKTFYTLLLLAFIAPATLASELHPMDRFIDDNTFLVARVTPDESALKLLDFFVEEVVPSEEAETKKTVLQAKIGIAAGIDMFKKAGLRDAYMMLTLSGGLNRDEFFYFVLHIKPDANEDALLTLLKQGFSDVKKMKTKRIGQEYLLIASEAIVGRLEHQKPTAHPELWKAFDSVDGSIAKVVLVPLDSSRRVIREMMPTLPEILGGDPSSVLTDGIYTAAAGLSTTPEISLEIKVQSKDNASAQAFRDWTFGLVNALPSLAATSRDASELSEPLKVIAKFYQPTIEGNEVRFALKESTDQIANLVKAIQPSLLAARQSAQKTTVMNQFKQLGLAMHNYADTYKTFSPAIHRDKEGKPLLSWRVHILPYLEQNELYKQFKLDEPWDSPHNKKLIERMPPIFRNPISKRTEPGMTNFVVVTGPDTVFPEDRGIELKEIKDGCSYTIMIVEADDDAAVIWTKPEDIKLDPENPKKHLGGLRPNGTFICTFADGSVHTISLKDVSDEKMLNLLRRNDGK